MWSLLILITTVYFRDEGADLSIGRTKMQTCVFWICDLYYFHYSITKETEVSCDNKYKEDTYGFAKPNFKHEQTMTIEQKGSGNYKISHIKPAFEVQKRKPTSTIKILK